VVVHQIRKLASLGKGEEARRGHRQAADDR
jgi:hypothetical protein